MIDRTHRLPITRQAEALEIARATVYALPKLDPNRDQQLMRRIDRLHLKMPFAGYRILRDLLAQEGVKVGRKHVATLMKHMGIEALYRKPRTTRKHPQHRVPPYLLLRLRFDPPNQVYAMDITHISMTRGFVYLVAVTLPLDLCQRFTRKYIITQPAEQTKPVAENLLFHFPQSIQSEKLYPFAFR